jgi:hypothetical protein
VVASLKGTPCNVGPGDGVGEGEARHRWTAASRWRMGRGGQTPATEGRGGQAPATEMRAWRRRGRGPGGGGDKGLEAAGTRLKRLKWREWVVDGYGNAQNKKNGTTGLFGSRKTLATCRDQIGWDSNLVNLPSSFQEPLERRFYDNSPLV